MTDKEMQFNRVLGTIEGQAEALQGYIEKNGEFTQIFCSTVLKGLNDIKKELEEYKRMK